MDTCTCDLDVYAFLRHPGNGHLYLIEKDSKRRMEWPRTKHLEVADMLFQDYGEQIEVLPIRIGTDFDKGEILYEISQRMLSKKLLSLPLYQIKNGEYELILECHSAVYPSPQIFLRLEKMVKEYERKFEERNEELLNLAE